VSQGGRTLIAGVGNVVFGDDGFGVEAVRLIPRFLESTGTEEQPWSPASF